MNRTLFTLAVLAACAPKPTDTETCDTEPLPAEPELCQPADYPTTTRWLAVYAPDGGERYTLDIDTPPGPSPWRLHIRTKRVEDATGEVLAYVFLDVQEQGDDGGNGLITVSDDGAEELIFEARPGRTFTIGVDLDYTSWGYDAGPQSAEILWSLEPIADCHEPNDLPEQATPVPSNTKIDAWFTRGETNREATNADWYAFTADGLSSYALTWGDLPTGQAIDVSIQDEAGEFPFLAQTYLEDPGSFDLGVLPAGVYKVAFTPFVGGTYSCVLEENGAVPEQCGALTTPYWFQLDRELPAPPAGCETVEPPPVVLGEPPELPPDNGLPVGVTDPVEVDPFDGEITGPLEEIPTHWRGAWAFGSGYGPGGMYPLCTGEVTATVTPGEPATFTFDNTPSCYFQMFGLDSYDGLVHLDGELLADGALTGTTWWDALPTDGSPDGDNGAFTGRFGVDSQAEPLMVGAGVVNVDGVLLSQPYLITHDLRLHLRPWTPPPPPSPPEPLPAGAPGVWLWSFLGEPDQAWPLWVDVRDDGAVDTVHPGRAIGVWFGMTADLELGLGSVLEADGSDLSVLIEPSPFGAVAPAPAAGIGHAIRFAADGQSAEVQSGSASQIPIALPFAGTLGFPVTWTMRRLGDAVEAAPGAYTGDVRLSGPDGEVCRAAATADVDGDLLVTLDVASCTVPANRFPNQPRAETFPADQFEASLADGVARLPAPHALDIAGIDGERVVFHGEWTWIPGGPVLTVEGDLTRDR